MENIGETLKPFIIKKNEIHLKELIGQGLYGQVYKGKYNHTDIAIKILTTEKIS